MTTRQPKGTPVGGQFAQDRKPQGTDLDPRAVNHVVIMTYQHVDIDDDHVSTPSFNRMRTSDWSDLASPDVIIQSFSMETVDIDDAEGWTAAGVASILRERGVTSATEDDIYDAFDSFEVESISFDPKRGIDRVLQEVDENLSASS
jgi:hypothetical protein